MPSREVLRLKGNKASPRRRPGSTLLKEFRDIVWDYYRTDKRDFPWRRTRDPYRILVSEIMLQQTQTYRVEPKYREFLKRFPDFKSLARAPLADVLRAWQGLGYNRRALALKKCAEIIVSKYDGMLPKDADLLDELPGIGPGTAGAIRAFAFNLRSAFIETNIRRAFIHFFFPDRRKVRDEEILKILSASPPKFSEGERWREWYWALMDYGAHLRQDHGGRANPNRKSAHYRKQSKFAGSNRELRGKILRLLSKKSLAMPDLFRRLGVSAARSQEALDSLKSEGFIEFYGSGSRIRVPY